MTSLKNQLTLELLKRKSDRRHLSQGFTLVELMIVIVIVGILSAVALPSFLSQQNKAKLTEATSKVSAVLKNAHADYQLSGDEDDAIDAAILANTEANKAGKYVYNVVTVAGADISASTAGVDLSPADILIVGADPNTFAGVTPETEDNQLQSLATTAPLSAGKVYGCINLNTGKLDVDRNLKDTVVAAVDGTGTTTTVAGLDCE